MRLLPRRFWSGSARTLFGNDEYRDELARAVGEGSFGGSWAANQVGLAATRAR